MVAVQYPLPWARAAVRAISASQKAFYQATWPQVIDLYGNCPCNGEFNDLRSGKGHLMKSLPFRVLKSARGALNAIFAFALCRFDLNPFALEGALAVSQSTRWPGERSQT